MNYIILHVSLKSLTKDNSRLKGTIESLSERNSQLESELVILERLKTENSDSKKDNFLEVFKERNLLRKNLRNNMM